jgi:predicted HAD superfamily Cof-like phosphohydrolase
MTDIIGVINAWNVEAGRTADHFNVRQVAVHTGLQCEELAEKLQAMGLDGIANILDQAGDELKRGWWDRAVEGCDREKVLDGDADLVVVTIGSAQAQGANFKGAMDAVIAANEAKRFPDGTLHINENAKILKPEGWTPPDLKPFLSSS